MFWSRIITRQDVRGPALRTAGDRVAVALVNVELLGLAGLWVASKLWFPALHQLWLHLWASVMIGRWVPLSMHLVDCCTRP